MTYAQAMNLVADEQSERDAADEAARADWKEKRLRLTLLFILMCSLYVSALVQERVYPLPTHTATHHAAKHHARHLTAHKAKF